MERLDLDVQGMSCGHCVAAVKGALAGLDGVRVDDVQIGSAVVEYDPAAVTPEQIAQAVAAEGYAAAPAAR
jgi:copper chaperone